MEELVEQQRKELLAQVPRPIKRAHMEKGLSFGRSEFVADILFHHPDGFKLTPKTFTKKTAKLAEHMRKPSVSTKDHLPYFFHECPFTEELAEYQKNSRLLTANVKRFSEKYITHGRVYPIYDLHKTSTGRSASSDPNGQNFPKRGRYAKAYRRLFVSPLGFFVLEADLSQAELRIAADMANDPVMLRIYREGGDIHRNTALIVMGVTAAQFDALSKEDQSLARFKAKAVNFGFLYGMGWRKFISYARTQYGVVFTEDEAQRIRNGFFRMYPRLAAWHDEMREFALTHGYVVSYDGRVRHLPMILSSEDYIVQEAVRQAINSPVQEFASSLGVMAMSKLSQEIDPQYLRPFGFVHDALYCLVPYENLEWGAKTLKHYMENVPLKEWFGLNMKTNMVADVGFGRNLADIVELKGLGSGPYDFSPHAETLNEYGIVLPVQYAPPKGGRIVLPPHMLPILD